MPSDIELLRLYVHDRSHEAFGELVRRHIDMVYSSGRENLSRRNQVNPNLALLNCMPPDL